MASRLRVRLRQARAAVERDLGCSLAVVVPRTDARGPPYLGTRAHSFSYGDYAMPDGRSTVMQRHRSALSHAAGSGAAPPPQSLPDLPPDSESEVARTILMLATPPAARALSPLTSPCLGPLHHGIGRRLSFSQCLDGDRPPKRPRADEPRPQRR
ncbi:hypothetical protein H4R19_002586 [Coemansia spiralis]|nr:hypothetical protein H4R19_002586 [Coemansia spiralis]